MPDPAPNASPDGRNTPASKAEVYVAEDGRPGLLLKRKNMGSDGDGWLIATVKAGMIVTGWASDDELERAERWKPVLPGDAAQRLDSQREAIEALEVEKGALIVALKKAVEMLPPAGAEVVRTFYRRGRGE